MGAPLRAQLGDVSRACGAGHDEHRLLQARLGEALGRDRPGVEHVVAPISIAIGASLHDAVAFARAAATDAIDARDRVAHVDAHDGLLGHGAQPRLRTPPVSPLLARTKRRGLQARAGTP